MAIVAGLKVWVHPAPGGAKGLASAAGRLIVTFGALDGLRAAVGAVRNWAGRSNQTDPALRELRSPTEDASALGELLAAPDIGGFTVETVLDRKAHAEDWITLCRRSAWARSRHWPRGSPTPTPSGC